MTPSPLEQLMDRLTSAGVPFEIHDDSIVVHKASGDGFSVKFSSTPDGFAVSYDGWQQVFDCEIKAMHCFVFGLSDRCRLKVFRREPEGEVYRWTVEYIADGQWLEASTMGAIRFEFWNNRVIEYRRNAALSAT